MRTVLPGRPQAKLQALSTALWDDFRVIVSKVPYDARLNVCWMLMLRLLLGLHFRPCRRDHK